MIRFMISEGFIIKEGHPSFNARMSDTMNAKEFVAINIPRRAERLSLRPAKALFHVRKRATFSEAPRSKVTAFPALRISPPSSVMPALRFPSTAR